MWLTRGSKSVPQAVGSLALFGITMACAGTAAAAEETGYTVLNPTGNPPPIERKAMAPRPASLSGKTVYLVDETFDGGDKFLQQMQAWMGIHMPDALTLAPYDRGPAYARCQNRVPSKEGCLLRRRPGSVEGNQIRRRPDDHGHWPLKHMRAGGRRPRCER